MELCLYTAMRISEVRALTWGDAANGKIRVDKTVKQGRDRYDEAGRTKGRKAHDIVIGPELMELIEEQRRLVTAQGFTTEADDLIFPNINKGFMGYPSLRAQVFLPADRTLRLQEGITDAERADLLSKIRELAQGTRAEQYTDAYCLMTRLLELPGAVLGRPRKGTEPSANEGILGTRYEDFNPRTKTLRIRDYDGEPVMLKLDNELVVLLQEHQQRTCLWSNRPGFIFIGRRGTALSALRYSVLVLDQAMREVGLKTDRTIHMFRHTAATFLINEGRSLVEVQQLLGHSRPSTTADIYSHAWKDAQEQKPQDALSAYAEKYGRPGRK
jgi:integrase